MRLAWGQHCEERVSSDVRANDLLRFLAGKYGISKEEADASVLKVVGEDAFLLDNHRLIDYEYVRERVAMGKVGGGFCF